MTVSATPEPETGGRSAPAGPQRPGRAPRADCVADSAGGLTFDVGPGDGSAREWDTLRLHRRGGDTTADLVSLPLVPAGAARLRAVLPSLVQLPEGRWDVYVAAGDAAPQRLQPGVNDLRSLVDRSPRVGRTWLGVRIPYATKYGNLALRSWLRWPHAEAGEILLGEEVCTVHGQLYGADLQPTARLEAHVRHGSTVVHGPVTPQGQRFSAVVPCGALAEHRSGEQEQAVWDLWLRPAESVAPVRVARILDDIPDKSQILRYPPVALPGATATPVYTGDNNLAVRLRWSVPA